MRTAVLAAGRLAVQTTGLRVCCRRKSEGGGIDDAGTSRGQITLPSRIQRSVGTLLQYFPNKFHRLRAITHPKEGSHGDLNDAAGTAEQTPRIICIILCARKSQGQALAPRGFAAEAQETSEPIRTPPPQAKSGAGMLVLPLAEVRTERRFFVLRRSGWDMRQAPNG